MMHAMFAISGGSAWTTVVSLMFTGLLAAIAIYAIPVPQGDRHWWEIFGLLATLVIAGVWVGEGMARTLLLDAAALTAVALVWVRHTEQAARAARTYLTLRVPAMAAILAGLYLVGEGNVPSYPLDRLAVGLLVIGFGLKLALIPFYFWLPSVAEASAPMTTAVIVSVVDITAFLELAHLRTSAPWVFSAYSGLWLTIAVLSMLIGALLALAQRDLKRMLAFSTMDDMGYLLLGVVVGPGVGLAGALLGALSHALLKVLLFGAVGIAEQGLGRPVTLADRGLAARFPISAAAFIVGAFGMIGVPPSFGFVGRWRLYLAGMEYGGPLLLLAMVVATILALLYYVRAIHRVWLGSGAGEPDRREPRLAGFVLITLSLVALGLGVFPWLVTQYVP
jgi:multicomponent Na+:H+ antiporter subunit D